MKPKTDQRWRMISFHKQSKCEGSPCTWMIDKISTSNGKLTPSVAAAALQLGIFVWRKRRKILKKIFKEKILAIVLFILYSFFKVSQLPSQRDREQIVHFLAFHILHGTLLRNYAILQILQILHASAICKTPSPRL